MASRGSTSGPRHDLQPPCQIRIKAVLGIDFSLDPQPLSQARVHGTKDAGGEASVLGQVHAPTVFQNYGIQMLKKGEQAPIVNRKIERKSVTFKRKRQQPWPLRPKSFEHGEKTGTAARGLRLK